MAKITDPYLNRVISQHKIRPKFMAWLAAINEMVEDTMNLYRTLDKAFELDTAVGVQLDTLGKEVGVERLLNFEPVYAAPLLSDEYYRMVIKAKISLNHWDGTTEGILELWETVFGGYKLEVVDHQDMTMTLRVINLNSLFESEFIARGYLAPKPQTVRVNYEFVLTRSIETTLYVGGSIVHGLNRFDLSTPEPIFSTKGGNLYAGGGIPVTRALFDLSDPGVVFKIEGGTAHVGGAITNVRTQFSLPANRPMEDKELRTNLYHGATVSYVRSAFNLKTAERSL